MKIQRKSLKTIDFDGLEILDYTAGLDGSSSMAEITVPAGVRHRRARSKRSDKYDYVIHGELHFVLDDQAMDLSAGDACIVRRGVRFSYENRTATTAKVLWVHTPSFDPAEEVFEEE